MAIFGGQRDSSDGGLLRAKWFRRLITFCCVLLVAAGCVEAYRRATAYARHVIELHPINARIEIRNPPPWLDRRIVQSLLDEAYGYAQKDLATYNRARNVLDQDILREIADLYVGPDNASAAGDSGQAEAHSGGRQAVGFNAWISGITEVRRNIAADKSVQTIEITATWRSPAAWVRARGTGSEAAAGGGANDMLYLVDAQGVRLPMEYPLADRSHTQLMVVTGVDLPIIGGKASVPAAGQIWNAGADGKAGEDLVAGMAMMKLLQPQPFVKQIDAIDMTNFNGRKNAATPWILLDTIWNTADGSPRVVQWGRPPGKESYYEVKATVKLRSLNEIYERFSRIDAGRDYVDIHTETIRLPKLASQIDALVQSPKG